MIITNQPGPGAIYYGVRLYKNGKSIGSHNGHRRCRNIQFFHASFYWLFIGELLAVCEKNGIECVTIEKHY